MKGERKDTSALVAPSRDPRMALEKELETYQAKLPTLLEHSGKFAVIHGDEVAGMMSQTQWKVALATPAEIEVNRPWLDQQATGLGTARPGPP